MKTKNLTISIPDGYDDVKFNEQTNEIEFVKKDDKPRSWEEYCDKVVDTDCFRASFATIPEFVPVGNRMHQPLFNEFNTEEEAKAFLALGKLIQLRDAWIGDWRPDWDKSSTKVKYVIYFADNKICATWLHTINHILSFPTKEMRDDFLETFRDLIEEAKPLL